MVNGLCAPKTVLSRDMKKEEKRSTTSHRLVTDIKGMCRREMSDASHMLSVSFKVQHVCLSVHPSITQVQRSNYLSVAMMCREFLN